MKTNQFFSFKRLGRLWQIDLQVNYKRYLLLSGVLFIVLYGILVFNMPRGDSKWGFEMLEYFRLFTVIVLLWWAIAGSSFPQFGNKLSARSYLLLPASTFEKYVSQFLWRIVGGGFLLAILFWVAALLARLTAMSTLHDPDIQIVIFNYPDFWDYIYNNGGRLYTAMNCFMGISLFVLRLFFNRNGLLKAVIALPVVISPIVLLTLLLSYIFYPERPLGHTPQYRITESLWSTNMQFYIIFGILGLALLFVGYFKLKEKEL